MVTVLLYDSNYINCKIIVPQPHIIRMQTIAFYISNLSGVVEYVLRL